MTQPDLISLLSAALPGSRGGDADAFRAALKLGEIIRGRVMRSLGEGRYSVSFHGQERIVDSAIPLRTDDILHGRVIALGDRVELQRVRTEPAQAAEAPGPAENGVPPGGYAELAELTKKWLPKG